MANDVASNTRKATIPVHVTIQYHQLAFDFLHVSRRKEIENALLERPAQLRSEIIGRLVPRNVVLDGPSVWPQIKIALDEIEGEMKAVLAHRSVPFWLHLYRRIGVHLHSAHDDKIDARTVALVREVVELAINKYGMVEPVTEFAPSWQLNAKKVLGGILAQATKSNSKPYSARRSLDRYMNSIPPQWVVRDFAAEDFVGLYYVEGLAYQYWKISALLRSLGKGASVEFTDDGDWQYHTSLAFDALIVSIDQRTERAKMESSLIGVWFRSELDVQKSGKLPLLIVPIYNVERQTANDIYRSFGLHLEQTMVSNFLPAVLDITPYLEAHGSFSDALHRRHGFGLATIILTIWALNQLALFQFESGIRSEDKVQSALIQNTFSLCQRGYRIAHVASNDQLGLIRLLIRTLELSIVIADDELARAIEFLRLSPQGQSQISLWSGGPRFPSIPFGDHHSLIDAHPIGAVLQTLFFRVQHDATKRGTLFENEFRIALERIGLPPRSGELHSIDGEVREVDALIRIGRKLIVIECVSVERPLDYEIGNPKTLISRQQRLDEKVSQVLSLADFIQSNPVGRNYVFNDIETIEAYVVSPFYEWIWEISNRLWVGCQPRIMAASEALDYLQSVCAGNSDT